MMSLIEEEESARVYIFGKEGDEVEEEAAWVAGMMDDRLDGNQCDGDHSLAYR